jgi:hypothetical protein
MRESYIPHSATVLGISPAIFGSIDTNRVHPKKKFQQEIKVQVTETKEDFGLLGIIKTLYEREQFVDEVINIIEPSMFGTYAPLLEAVIKNEKNNPILTRLILEENIKIMEEEKFREAIKNFLITYYKKQRKSILLDSSISTKKKIFLNRKIQQYIIPRLEKGELVAYKFKP